MPAANDVGESILVALRKIIRAIDLHSKQLAHHYGLTGPQLIVLKELNRTGSMQVGKLAKTISLSHATVSGIVDRLQKRELLVRERSQVDRRSITVTITEAGTALLASAPSPLQDQFLAELTKLKEWEQTLLLSSLQRIASMMSASDIDASPLLVSGPVSASASDTARVLSANTDKATATSKKPKSSH